MKVLVIPEDFRKDQYMLKPIIEAMLAKLGKPRANVVVCKDPLLGGINQALKWELISSIIKRYKMVDLILLCVDRDGESGRRIRLNNLEEQARLMVGSDKLFIAENAWQEIEVWILAGHDFLPGWSWQDIRAEINPKERYFNELAEQRGLQNEPGNGRKTLSIEAARRYNRIRQLCSEDLANMEERIRQWIQHTL